MKQKLLDIFNLLFGFRKIIAWLALFMVAILFRMDNLLDGSQFVDLMKTTFMAFVAANGFEHIVGMAKEYNATKAQMMGGVVKTPAPEDSEKEVD